MITPDVEPKPDEPVFKSRAFRYGVLTTVVIVGIPLLGLVSRSTAGGGVIIATLFSFPILFILGGILAFPPSTRRFALGLLLADAFALLLLVAICGGGLVKL